MFSVIIDEEVYKQDFRYIDKHQQQIIVRTIEKKLTIAPEKYGEPLRKELYGYWKLRVGDYRVIYKIKNRQLIVLVVMVGPRKDDLVYRGMVKRRPILEQKYGF